MLHDRTGTHLKYVTTHPVRVGVGWTDLNKLSADVRRDTLLMGVLKRRAFSQSVVT